MTKGKFQVTAHVLHQRPTCRLVDFVTVNGAAVPEGSDSEIVLRPGDQARVKFRLVHGSYYLRAGMKFVLRHGAVRGVGKIKETT